MAEHFRTKKRYEKFFIHPLLFRIGAYFMDFINGLIYGGIIFANIIGIFPPPTMELSYQ